MRWHTTALSRRLRQRLADLFPIPYASALVKRATFQGTASMLFPALTIHSTVKYSGPLFKRIQNPKIRGWGPTVAGLAVVPFLPYIFDKPIEHAVDWGFEKLEPLVTTHSGPVREDVSSEKKDL